MTHTIGKATSLQHIIDCSDVAFVFLTKRNKQTCLITEKFPLSVNFRTNSLFYLK